MARIIVGLFTSAAEAGFAVAQLRAAGFAAPAVQLATRATLQAQHLPGAIAPAETFEDGVVQFFSNLFSGSSQVDDAQAHIAATGPDTAIITVETTTAAEAERARALLDRNGAVDVYKQRPFTSTTGAGEAEASEIDLEGDLRRVRDDDELDANGLTTH